MSAQIVPPLPLAPETWDQLAEELKLSPQHKRIVELILRNRCDKQIHSEIGMAHSTLRTHLGRIFHRLKVHDRADLVLMIFAMSHGIRRHG